MTNLRNAHALFADDCQPPSGFHVVRKSFQNWEAFQGSKSLGSGFNFRRHAVNRCLRSQRGLNW